MVRGRTEIVCVQTLVGRNGLRPNTCGRTGDAAKHLWAEMVCDRTLAGRNGDAAKHSCGPQWPAAGHLRVEMVMRPNTCGGPSQKSTRNIVERKVAFFHYQASTNSKYIVNLLTRQQITQQTTREYDSSQPPLRMRLPEPFIFESNLESFYFKSNRFGKISPSRRNDIRAA